ncbi:hypothetical protein OPAG_09108 [Rhodococcus opacus PD630]|nr:hypothetical protein OPAG_09108 [Rhodococcus opacus PD630]
MRHETSCKLIGIELDYPPILHPRTGVCPQDVNRNPSQAAASPAATLATT